MKFALAGEVEVICGVVGWGDPSPRCAARLNEGYLPQLEVHDLAAKLP